MSGGVFGAIGGAVSALGVDLIDDVYALIFSPTRMIGTLMPGVTVQESHRDDMAITDHPVERGAAISDHAFMLPAQVEMRCGWSDTQGGPGYVRQVYEALLTLQRMREPFHVFTGKRAYTNMLIRSLGVNTDEKTEHALMVVCVLREVIIVDTQTVTAGAQANPAKTAGEVNAGTKQVAEVAGGSNLIPQRRDT